MNKALIYGFTLYAIITLLGFLNGLLIPCLLIGALIFGLVTGYNSKKDIEATTISVMVLSELGGLLLYPDVLYIIGLIIPLCILGAVGSVIGHRRNPSHLVSSVPQPAE